MNVKFTFDQTVVERRDYTMNEVYHQGPVLRPRPPLYC